MHPSSPLPHPHTPRPLYPSPSSLANIPHSARRRRNRLVDATSDNESPAGVLLTHGPRLEARPGAGGPTIELNAEHGQDDEADETSRMYFPSSSSLSEVTMPVELSNWRRLPKSTVTAETSSQSSARAVGIKVSGYGRISEGSKSGTGSGSASTASATKVGMRGGTGTRLGHAAALPGVRAGSGSVSGTGTGSATGRSKGLGMGMKGTPARKGWSKSKSRSKVMGSHSTPNDIMAARSRSHSRSSSHTAHTTLAPLPSRISSHGQFNGSRGHGDQTGVDSSSSRSSLPLTHTPADRTEDSLDLPSGLQSPDITIPTIPNRPTHSPLHRYSGPIQPDDVFSASYAPVRLNRPPPGLSFHADPGADGVDEHDQLVRMAEAEAGQSSHDDWSGPDEHGDGDTGERDEEAIRDMMFPGMVDMLWPVISSSDIPSGERDSALDLEEGEGHADEDSISGPVGNARGRGYVDFDMPVKGTPYRLGVARDGGTANLASLTCDARDTRSSGTPVPRRQSARRPMKPSEATSGSDSSNGSRMLKSAMKHSSLVSPIKTPRPIKGILLTIPGAAHRSESVELSSDEYTSSEQAHTDDGKSTASRTEGGESTTGGDDTGNMDVVWSFDQPLRGDTMDFTPRPASDAIRTPTRSDSARKEISSRPKTPIHLGAHVSRSKTMMLQSDTDDESVRSTPIPHVGRAEEETPARNHTDQRGGARAGQKRLDREVEVGDRTVGLDKRPVLDRTLSELLQSDDEEGDDELPFLPEGARTAMRPAAEVELTVPSPDAVLDVARGRRGHSSGGTPGLAAVESLTRRKRRPGGKSTEEKGDQSRLFDIKLSQLLRTSSDAGDLDNVGQTPQTQRHHVGAKPTRPRHTSSAVHARRIDTPRPPRSTARMEHRFSSAKPRNTVKDAHVSAHRSRPAVNVDEVNDIEISRSKPTRPAEGGQMSSVLDAVDAATSGMDGDCNAPVGFDMHDGDDEDEYEPLMDFIDIPDERMAVEREGRQGGIRQREQSVQSFHSPAPWTPSSHRGSPAPWQHDHSSSPLTFSPSLSPMRLLTPPLELPTIGLATAGKRRRYDGETTSGRQKVKGRKMKRKGAWRGEEVMRRMEEGDREEAEFWLWVQNDGVAIRSGSTRGTNKRSHGSRVDTDDGSGRDLDDDLDAGSLSVALDGRGKGTQSRARKKIKRDQVLQALYDTEAAREAMRRRVRHYEELAEAYELRVESVW